MKKKIIILIVLLIFILVLDFGRHLFVGFNRNLKLQSVIKRADMLVVYDEVCENSKKVYESNNQNSLTEFASAIKLELRDSGGTLARAGNLKIKFYSEGNFLGEVERVLKYGHTVRSNIWGGDAYPQDPKKFNQWFIDRNIDIDPAGGLRKCP